MHVQHKLGIYAFFSFIFDEVDTGDDELKSITSMEEYVTIFRNAIPLTHIWLVITSDIVILFIRFTNAQLHFEFHRRECPRHIKEIVRNLKINRFRRKKTIVDFQQIYQRPPLQ